MARGKPTANAPLLHVLRFHVRSGARVALRANGVVAAIVIFLFGLEMEALDHVHQIVLQLMAVDPRRGSRWLFAGLCLVIAADAAPRVKLSTRGWLRALPVSAATARRAAIVAISLTEAFPFAVVVASVVLTKTAYHTSLDLAKLVGLLLTIVSAAFAVLPVERRIGAVTAGIAFALSIPGRWVYDVGSIAALVFADRFAGGVAPSSLGRPRVGNHWRWHPSPIGQWLRLTLRAVPAGRILSDSVLAVVFIGFGYLVVLHNPDFTPVEAARTVRVCGMLAFISIAATVATTIVHRRPVWVWVRSLPWSSRQRVYGDCLVIAAPLSIGALFLVPLDWRSAAFLMLAVPPIAAAAALAIRVGARRQTSAALEPVATGLAIGALIAFWPWAALLALCVTPLLFRWGVQRDQASAVTRWEELHHDALGDPAWIRS